MRRLTGGPADNSCACSRPGGIPPTHREFGRRCCRRRLRARPIAVPADRLPGTANRAARRPIPRRRCCGATPSARISHSSPRASASAKPAGSPPRDAIRPKNPAIAAIARIASASQGSSGKQAAWRCASGKHFAAADCADNGSRRITGRCRRDRPAPGLFRRRADIRRAEIEGPRRAAAISHPPAAPCRARHAQDHRRRFESLGARPADQRMRRPAAPRPRQSAAARRRPAPQEPPRGPRA